MLGGATSADVHTGLGHPGSGQASNEVNYSGKAKGEASGASIDGGQNDSFKELGLDQDHPTAGRGENGEEFVGAEEKDPMTAEAVADELA